MPRKDASNQTSSRRRLGRGLTSLMSTAVPIESPAPKKEAAPPTAEGQQPEIRFVPTDRINPNPGQPRRHFDEAALAALGESIRSAGLMQPIVVRPDASGGYQLVVGERRWRAARNIGLETVPAIVREIDDQVAAEWALIENIQREDLNPLERADAFLRLTQDFGLTHQQVAERVGLNRSSVTNLLRLHELDDATKSDIRTGRLSLAQSKVLLSIANLEARRQLALMAMREEWSVRTLQRRAAGLTATPKRRAAPTAGAPHRHDLERRLGEHLGTKVQIQQGKRKGSGRLLIEFYSLDQFDGLMQKLGFKADEL